MKNKIFTTPEINIDLKKVFLDLFNKIKPEGISIKNNIGSLNMLYLIKVSKLLAKKFQFKFCT
jgi:hypothetical protein